MRPLLIAATALFPMPAIAQTPNDIANLTELIVVEDQVVTLPPSGLKYKNVTIKRNGKIFITGSTTILTGKFITESGAAIVYKQSSQPRPKSLLTINAVDASGLTQLTVVGDGLSQNGYAPGQRAPDGPNGQGAVTECHGIIPSCSNHSASGGQPGQPGAEGPPGESAVDVTLYLPGVKPGAEMVVESIGGTGGRGQDGGHGGQGGGSNRVHPAANGGPGGSAGSGGRGGDAGNVHVFLVLAPADLSKKEEFIKSVKLTANIAAGRGGDPGGIGAGGTAGDNSDQFCIGAGCGQGAGSPGAQAQPGPPGDGPTAGQITQKWVSVEAMDLTSYQSYVAQLWNQLSN